MNEENASHVDKFTIVQLDDFHFVATNKLFQSLTFLQMFQRAAHNNDVVDESAAAREEPVIVTWKRNLMRVNIKDIATVFLQNAFYPEIGSDEITFI